MSKFVIVVCAVICSVAAQPDDIRGDDPVRTVQLNVLRLINKTISNTQKTFDTEKENLSRIGIKFTQEAYQFKKPIRDKILSIVQKIDLETEKFSRNSSGYITSDCVRHYENLISTVNYVESNTSTCIDKKLKSRHDYIAGIITIFEDELTSLNSMIKEIERCSDNIITVKTAFSAIDCFRAVRVKANRAAETSSKLLNSNVASLNASVKTFQGTLADCSRNSGFDDLERQSTDVVRKTRECIQRHDRRDGYEVQA